MRLSTTYTVPGSEVMPDLLGMASNLPAGFQSLPDRRLQRIDRRLGYFGSSRYVLFYYEPRGQEVVWNDGRSYGFACGGWQAFTQDVAPVAHGLGANLGDADHPGTQALVVDRKLGHVYFGDRAIAKRFVQEQASAAA